MSQSYHHQSYDHPVDVLRFAAQYEGSYALVVVTAVTGGAMRARGALMCVGEGGDNVGYVSNGCVDADIILQARRALSESKPRKIAYGEGSAFKDIKLPCGGRIDLWIIPNPDHAIISALSRNLETRQSSRLSIGDDGALGGNGGFSIQYKPKLKLRIAGRGEGVTALFGQAKQAGFDVIVQTPDADIVEGAHHLLSPSRLPDAKDDASTAVILMFHDHDWEPYLLRQALSGPAFYVGALGSQKTHAARCEALKNLGISASDIDRIHAPIGMIPSMRQANLLALSTLAEIVSHAQDNDLL